MPKIRNNHKTIATVAVIRDIRSLFLKKFDMTPNGPRIPVS